MYAHTHLTYACTHTPNTHTPNTHTHTHTHKPNICTHTQTPTPNTLYACFPGSFSLLHFQDCSGEHSALWLVHQASWFHPQESLIFLRQTGPFLSMCHSLLNLYIQTFSDYKQWLLLCPTQFVEVSPGCWMGLALHKSSLNLFKPGWHVYVVSFSLRARGLFLPTFLLSAHNFQNVFIHFAAWVGGNSQHWGTSGVFSGDPKMASITQTELGGLNALCISVSLHCAASLLWFSATKVSTYPSFPKEHKGETSWLHLVELKLWHAETVENVWLFGITLCFLSAAACPALLGLVHC